MTSSTGDILRTLIYHTAPALSERLPRADCARRKRTNTFGQSRHRLCARADDAGLGQDLADGQLDVRHFDLGLELIARCTGAAGIVILIAVSWMGNEEDLIMFSPDIHNLERFVEAMQGTWQYRLCTACSYQGQLRCPYQTPLQDNVGGLSWELVMVVR